MKLHLLLTTVLALAASPISVQAQREDGLPPPPISPELLKDIQNHDHLASKWRAAFDAQQKVDRAIGHTIEKEEFERLLKNDADKKKDALDCERRLSLRPGLAASWAGRDALVARRRALQPLVPRDQAIDLQKWADFLDHLPHL